MVVLLRRRCVNADQHRFSHADRSAKLRFCVFPKFPQEIVMSGFNPHRQMDVPIRQFGVTESVQNRGINGKERRRRAR